MAPPRGKVLIIGAGIGGLTLARALHLRGIECELFEREAELAPVGAGILVQTSAMRALRTLGLDETIAHAGESVEVGVLRTERGRTLQTTPMAFLEAEFGVRTVAIQRGRLQAALLGGVREIPLHRGAELARYDADAAGVTAHFADGQRVHGALLVGADGLRSAVRRVLLGETPLRYAGYTSWRGIAHADGAVPPHEVCEMWGPGARFGYAGIGHGEAYWFAVRNAPAGETEPDPLAVVTQHFSSWAEPVPHLLAKTAKERVFRTDIHDREPVRSWFAGRVTLLGDAAHPTTPNLGQGGCMAIEDAVTLAHALGQAATLEQALGDYERRRLDRTAAIVRASFRFGKLAQLENPLALWLRNTLVRLTPLRTVQTQLRRAAEFSLAGTSVSV